MILVDTGGLLTALDPRQADHELAARVLVRPQRRLLSPFVLAQRHHCYDLLTLDQRHFRAVLGPSGLPFRLLPADDNGR